jgi:hypothetical protein
VAIENLVGGIPTPLKNDGVRQLGSLFPTYGKKTKTKPPTRSYGFPMVFLLFPWYVPVTPNQLFILNPLFAWRKEPTVGSPLGDFPKSHGGDARPSDSRLASGSLGRIKGKPGIKRFRRIFFRSQFLLRIGVNI